jgi:hypothetical protein
MTVNNSNRVEKDEFYKRLKKEWKLMWTERFDDAVKAEGIVTSDYPLLFMDRGSVIFASRDARTPNFKEITEFWQAQGLVYAPSPAFGGWGRFMRTQIKGVRNSRASASNLKSNLTRDKQQMRKDSKGWLHIR